MKVAFLRSACPLMIVMLAFVCIVGCGESGSKNGNDADTTSNVNNGESKKKEHDIEDGADPSVEVTQQRQQANEYLQTLQSSQNADEEREATTKLVEWLQELKKEKAIKIEVSNDASKNSTIHVICFPPTYASLEYQFKDVANMKLFEPVLFVE